MNFDREELRHAERQRRRRYNGILFGCLSHRQPPFPVLAEFLGGNQRPLQREKVLNLLSLSRYGDVDPVNDRLYPSS